MYCILLIAGVIADSRHVGSPYGMFTLIMLGVGILFAWFANKYLMKKKQDNDPQ